ncbi:MAG: ABC transporter substrate-binding protein [Flavobacteriaceae bacterium]|nr:MAG: ABC transporter substrate-binding protein [Flavobacteriaceae bacterium]
MKKWYCLFFPVLMLAGCREAFKPERDPTGGIQSTWTPKYANGFSVAHGRKGVAYLTIKNPWPGTERDFRYALVPREQLEDFNPRTDSLDGVVGVPVQRLILTSTTHVPSLETLGLESRLVGFPGLDYISSPKTRRRIETGAIEELGANEQLNAERVLSLDPDLVVGFGVSGAPNSYQALEVSGVPVVYNGDWMEEDPLGKAEWILFFGFLLGKEEAAQAAFERVEKDYQQAKALAAGATESPTVMSGALYRDVWYLPAGDSWAARFIRDANARYLWEKVPGTGSLSLSLESVLEKGAGADYWIAPSQFTSYTEMARTNEHYRQFAAFREKEVYTYALSRGPKAGLLYYERGPGRPDLILKDLIYWLHPGLLPDYEPVFFKPLEP